MSDLLNTCPHLQADCDRLLELLNAEPKLRSFDITPVQTSLRKAVSPTFEIEQEGGEGRSQRAQEDFCHDSQGVIKLQDVLCTIFDTFIVQAQ